MEGPLVTVAMPVYNPSSDFRRSVLSILNQTFQNWELLILDDGSTIDVQNLISDIFDSRIKIIRDEVNQGIAYRLNQAISIAKGEYLARMDHDDISYPDRFERQLAAFKNDGLLDLVAVRAISINDAGNPVSTLPFALSHKDICSKPWLGFYMPHPTWMGKLSWFKKHQYKVPQSYYSEDCELLLRTYENSKFACLPEVLFEYRIKGKINWMNHLKARRAVLKLQFSHFYKRRQYLYIILSIIVFVLRVIFDYFKVLKQFLGKA